jgi:prepilin-type N-terminal cleavage/methylation domain-containing protein
MLPDAMGVYNAQIMGSMNSRNKYEAGFTLLEIVIVVAIISVGATLAIPSYSDWNSRYQLRDAITTIQSNLMLARMAAMNRNRVVNVNFNVVAGQVTVNVQDASGSGVLPAATMMGHVTTIDVANSAGNFVTPGAISFNPRGLRQGGQAAQPQVVRVTNDRGLVYSAAVTPGGKVRWCSTATCS